VIAGGRQTLHQDIEITGATELVDQPLQLPADFRHVIATQFLTEQQQGGAEPPQTAPQRMHGLRALILQRRLGVLRHGPDQGLHRLLKCVVEVCGVGRFG
jgi:hypothetical protein